MLAIIGFIVVFGSVLGGFILSHGDPVLLWQPYELLIILGAAIGAFVVSCTSHVLKLSLKSLPKAFFGKGIGHDNYTQVLALLHALFTKMHREGIISIEKDIEDPKSSGLFQRFPLVCQDLTACYFIGDTMRTYLTTGKGDDLGALMDADLKSITGEDDIPFHNINRMAESLPGMGIVAAVLGVVLTMSMISEPPEVLGHHIGAALIGTFLGILLCYGVFGPLAAKVENMAHERACYLKCIREAVMAALKGFSPMVALEYGRRSIPPSYRPTFSEMEQTLK